MIILKNQFVSKNLAKFSLSGWGFSFGFFSNTDQQLRLHSVKWYDDWRKRTQKEAPIGV
jgi:hypothetical protein